MAYATKVLATTTAVLVGVSSTPYQYAEDSKGRLYQLVNPFNQTSALHYDLDGKNLEVDFPNGTKELRTYYSPRDWLNTITLQAANGAADDSTEVQIGGLAGLLAPLVGKQPPDSHVWIMDGPTPAFVKSEQPLFLGGPVWRIELVSPEWPRPKP